MRIIRTELGTIAYEVEAPDENLGKQFKYYSNGYVSEQYNYTDNRRWYKNELDERKNYKELTDDFVKSQKDNLISVLEDMDIIIYETPSGERCQRYFYEINKELLKYKLTIISYITHETYLPLAQDVK